MLLALAAALALAPLPLPRSTAIAPGVQPLTVAVAAAPALPDLLAAQPRWPHVAAPQPRALPEKQATELQAALQRARAAFGVYGAQVAVSWDASQSWTGADGVMRDGRTPLSAEQPLVIGSVTKTFTAALILQLAEEGRLSLNDPVARYLPKVPRLTKGITVRELLGHTSGLADFYNPLHDALIAQPHKVWTPDEVLRRIGPMWFKPGADWGYSNTNYVVLGLLAEAVTGVPVEAELARRFFLPLGLDRTHLVSTDGGKLVDTSWTTSFWTAGAITSTASDLVRWGDALYGGSVLKPATLRAMLTFNDDDYGLGARRLPFGKHVGVGHTGLLATYTAIVVHFPADGVTVALLVNRSKVDLPAMLSARLNSQPSLLDLALKDGG